MYKLSIGLEIHVELLTKTKMFSSSANSSNNEPNKNINEIDLALPGTLPSVNKEAVILAIKLAKALNMEINSSLKFDRKNYFYSDLPKGYQITQFFNPIGINGILQDDGVNVKIERIHLEEDTAKQTKNGDDILLDYNRAGVPLIEIVTKPDIHSKEECILFLKSLKQLLIFLQISDGKMEDGSLRVDLNISISKNNELGTRAEIKNINSFYSVINAIDYEYKRQFNLIENNQKMNIQTRRWNDEKLETIFMRDKKSDDYRYMTEPNIPAIDILNLINSTPLNQNELPKNIKQKLIDDGVNNDVITQLLEDYPLYKSFKYVSEHVEDQKSAINWIVFELKKLINANNDSTENIKKNVLDEIIKMIKLIQDNKINGKQAKLVIEEIYKNNENIDSIIKKLNLIQITDENSIRDILSNIIKNNPDIVSQYKERPERVEKFIFGLLMKETKGQANPIVAKNILINLLK